MQAGSKLALAPIVALAVWVGGCASGTSEGSGTVSPGPTAGAAAPGAPVRMPDEAGRAIFLGKGNCYACHGPEGGGTLIGPDLTDDEWLIADGSVESIVKVVTEGVAQPATSSQPMPARGGGVLSDDEIRTVAQYVVSLGR